MRNIVNEDYYVYILLSVIIFMDMCICSGCIEKKYMKNNKYITQIMRKAPIHYSTDGAGGSDIDKIIDIHSITNKYKDSILPLLIGNLSNSTTSESTVDGKQPVPLGYVCFDLLCTILEPTNDWFRLDCGDDGLWVCVRDEYFIPIENNAWNQYIAIAAQKHWQILYETGKLKIDQKYLIEKK